jgi:hypothetical protein
MQVKRNPYAVEPLEPRRMLALVPGTSGNDSISISFFNGLTHVVVNGGDHVTPDLDITVNAFAGNDVVSVASTRLNSAITILGGPGDDLLQNTVADLDAVFLATVDFNGGDGNDTVAADNGADATVGGRFRIQGNGVLKENPDDSLILWSLVENVVYADSDNANTIRFGDLRGPTHDVTNLTIRGHGGNDFISNEFAPFWGTSVGSGSVNVDGGPGSDQIFLSNISGSAPASYLINSTSIDVSSTQFDTGVLTYANCENMDFTGSDQADTVLVNSKPATMIMSFAGQGGDDAFTIGGGDLDSNGFGVGTTIPSGFSGGSGNDSIRIDDRFDAEGEIETCTFGIVDTNRFGVSKGNGKVALTDLEAQVYEAANAVAGISAPNIINVHATSNATQSLTINGGANRACNVTVGDGFNFDAINGTITANLQGGTVGIGSFQNPVVYRLTQTRLLTPKVVNYSGVDRFNIGGSTGIDVFLIDGVASGTTVAVGGGGGADQLSLGAGNIDADLLGPVTFDGGADADSVTVNNALDASAETQVLTASTFTDGSTHTFTTIESLIINEGPGGTNLTITATGAATTINGGGASDTFTVGGGDINANLQPTPARGLTINGQGGSDQIFFDDLNDNSLDRYVFQRPAGTDQLVKDGPSDYFISWTGVENVTLEGNNAPASPLAPCEFLVTNTTTPLRIRANAGSDRITVSDAGVPLFVHTGLGDADSLIVNNDFTPGDTPVTIVVDQTDDLETLDIHPAGIVRVTAGATLTKTRLGAPAGVLNISGVLDLAGGAFLSRAGGPTIATFQSLLVPGFNSGSWNGTSATGAINSSLAASSPLRDGVGYGLGSQIAVGSLGGFLIQPDDVLLRYTLDGDANLDALVNLQDFNRLASSFGAGSLWSQGNFNYDSIVNLSDFNLLAGNFGHAAAAPATFARGGAMQELERLSR